MSEGAYADDAADALSAPAGYATPQVEEQVQRLRQAIEAARPMPLSVSSMINKEEILEYIDAIGASLPDELRAARWLLKEREEFLEKVRREGDEILAMARAGSERMVQRTEVVKAAEARARQIVDAADAEARRLKHEAEDYCDQKLGSFEIALERTLGVVAAGRAKLQGNPLADLASASEPEPQRAAVPAAEPMAQRPRPAQQPPTGQLSQVPLDSQVPRANVADTRVGSGQQRPPQASAVERIAPIDEVDPADAYAEYDEFGAPAFFDQELE